MSDEHSKRTYQAAKDFILADSNDPYGIGLAKQLITEAVKLPFKILGISLLVLARALQKNPNKVEEARKILK